MEYIIRNKWVSASIFALLLTSCDSTNNEISVSDGASTARLAAPAAVARAVDTSALFAELTLSYTVESEPFVDRNTVSRSAVSGTWDIELNIPPYTLVTLDVTWFDTEDTERVDLTTLTRVFRSSDPGNDFTVLFDFSDYDDDTFNSDADEFTNLEERINGTSPLISNTPQPTMDGDGPDNPTLDAPPFLIDTIPAQDLVVGISTSIDLSAYFRDPENNTLTYRLGTGSLPPSERLSLSEVGIFTGVTLIDDVGRYEIEIVASDENASATGMLNLNVLANQRPIAIPIADVGEVGSGEMIVVEAGQSFTDPEGVQLSFALNSTPDSELIIDSTSGSITGQIANPGEYTLTVLAGDGITEPVSSSFSVTQLASTQAMLSDPTPGSLSLSTQVLESISESFSFSNLGSAELDYTLSTSEPWLMVSSTQGSLAGGETASIDATAVCGQDNEAQTGSIGISSEGDTRILTVSLSCSAQPSEPLDDVASVKVGDNQGEFFLGVPPTQTNSLVIDQPALGTTASTVIPGGSISIPISAQSPFSVIYIVANDTSKDTAGYFQVTLPEPVLSTSILLNYDVDISIGATQQIAVQVATADGSVSNTTTVNSQTLSAGTGELQISLSWDKQIDLDLSLLEPAPGSFTIDWRTPNRTSPNNGRLDVDSNVLCTIDDNKVENITYDGSTPPNGEYTVFVTYFNVRCAEQSTNYVVTVRNNGVVSTFSGVLSTLGEVRPIVTFQVNNPVTN